MLYKKSTVQVENLDLPLPTTHTVLTVNVNAGRILTLEIKR
jgi:hypothetical protein